jgi:hypothetical protein
MTEYAGPKVISRLEAALAKHSVAVACTYCRHEFEVGEDVVAKNGPCYFVRPGHTVICPNGECEAVMMSSRLLVDPEEIIVWEEDEPQGEA